MSQKYVVKYEDMIGEIIFEFTHDKRQCVVLASEYDGSTSFWAGYKDEIQEEQKSYHYLVRAEHQRKLDEIKKNIEEEKVKLVDKALGELESRLRLNAAFSEDGKMSIVGITVANELKKIIKEKKI